jgi:hypothetical protein
MESNKFNMNKKSTAIFHEFEQTHIITFFSIQVET